MKKSLYARHVVRRVADALEDSPVVLIQGPRQCGKTTLAQIAGEAAGYAYVSFDDKATLDLAVSDPTGFVNNLPERVIIDEAQKAPDLFSTIKLSVDNNRVPGRFILTGSVSILHVKRVTDSLAGRMRIISLYPLSQCELAQTEPTFLDSLFDLDYKISKKAITTKQIVERIVCGGYPEVLARTDEKRRMAWYQDYIEAIIRHDVSDVSALRSHDELSKLMSFAATQTGQLFNLSNLSRSFQYSRETAHNYIAVLETMFMIDKVPAWHNNRGKRLVKTPKLHISDTGIACSLMGLDKAALMQDRDQLGHLFETFVFQELKRQSSGHDRQHTFSHFRDRDGAEVDLVIERSVASLVGVEVKASATVRPTDFKGLRKLKEVAGKRFKGGVIVYSGETCLPFGEKMYALPLRFLWESA